MSCEQCQSLSTEYRIVSPDELRRAIVGASRRIAEGSLREFSLEGEYTSPTDFQKVAAGADWDDIVSYYFQCPCCGQRFRLGAETYHGGGGSWALVPANSADRD